MNLWTALKITILSSLEASDFPYGSKYLNLEYKWEKLQLTYHDECLDRKHIQGENGGYFLFRHKHIVG